MVHMMLSTRCSRDSLLKRNSKFRYHCKLLQTCYDEYQATKVFQRSSKAASYEIKHLVRFNFRKNSRQGLLEQSEEGKESRHRKLHKLDCGAQKLCGLSYTTEKIVKLGNAGFEIFQTGAAEFICHSNLSYLLYGPDESFDKFMQYTQCSFLNRLRLSRPAHTARRLSAHKRKYNAIASPNEAAQGEFDRCISLQMVDLADCKRVDEDKGKHGIGKVWRCLRCVV